MPEVYPFHAIQYQAGRGSVSDYVSPPYDVLDEAGKRELLARDDRNIVSVDLPQVPAKQLGAPEVYRGANELLDAWLADGTLARRGAPAMFAYRQSFNFLGDHYKRCGMCCTVETAGFGARPGGGILPHEQTFSGPKEDRFALMRETSTQTSPIFGLHADEEGLATTLLHRVMESRDADMTAQTSDGVTHEVWTIEDDATLGAYRDALAGEDVFIADGHHRYTTALNYLRHLEDKGPVGTDHPARRCMIVLVGMSDPGLAIGPTHRVLGGMSGYSLDAFRDASGGLLEFHELGDDPHAIEGAIDAKRAETGRGTLGVIDFETGACRLVTTVDPDPLAAHFPDKPAEWRTLDVALIQHLIVERICEPKLNGGDAVTWAFPHAIDEVLAIGRGEETGAGGGSGFAQLAVIVRPTPLDAVRAVSRAGELMPQKSTFFYPKLATGLFLNPLS